MYQLNYFEMKKLKKFINTPPLPSPPLARIIKEGTVGSCLKCGSTEISLFGIFRGRK